VSQSRAYAGAAQVAGDDVRLRELPGVDHFTLVDPASAAWAIAVAELARLLPQL
jgi:acetyl esterase/lipase